MIDNRARALSAINDSQLEEITNQGQIKGQKVVSLLEYNALTEQEKNNGNIYFTYDE